MKLLLALVSAVALSSQAHPDFSGTWVEDEAQRKTTLAAPANGAKSAALPPVDTVITQTPTSITIEQSFMGHLVRYAYKLDGSESVNHNGANTTTTKSVWEGATLVTTGTSFSVTSQGESNWVITERRSLDKKGTLTVDTTYKDDAGKTDHVTRVFQRKK
jgi:hypothetical protein